MGAPELLVVLAVAVPLGVVIWGVVDAAGRPAGAFEAAGSNKALWIGLQVGGLLIFGVGGLVLAIVYLVAIRPRVVTAGAGPV